MPLFRRSRINNNFDLIMNCTDKLLSNWHAKSIEHIHRDIVQQCQNLLLEIFGLISFDYDLGTLDDHDSNRNELTHALQEFMNSMLLIFFSPKLIGSLYTKLSRRHQQAKATLERYIYQMIDNEMMETKEFRAERKRTCLVASLVDSLQDDEEAEAKKKEDEIRGK